MSTRARVREAERIYCLGCGKHRVLTKQRSCRVCGWRVVSIKWQVPS